MTTKLAACFNIVLDGKPREEELTQIPSPLFRKRERFMRKPDMHAPTGINDVRIIRHYQIDEKDALHGGEALRIFRIHGQLSPSLRSQCGAREFFHGCRRDALKLGGYDIADPLGQPNLHFFQMMSHEIDVPLIDDSSDRQRIDIHDVRDEISLMEEPAGKILDRWRHEHARSPTTDRKLSDAGLHFITRGGGVSNLLFQHFCFDPIARRLLPAACLQFLELCLQHAKMSGQFRIATDDQDLSHLYASAG